MSIKSAATPQDKLVICVFCGEPDFDLIGLKMHLELKWCEVYEKLDEKRSATTALIITKLEK